MAELPQPAQSAERLATRHSLPTDSSSQKLPIERPRNSKFRGHRYDWRNMFEQQIAQLATAIQEAVTRYREASPIPTRRHVRVRRRDFSLKYQEDFGFANFAPERIEEDAWDWGDQERFQDSAIKGLKEYQSLVAALGPNTDSVEQFARAGVLCELSRYRCQGTRGARQCLWV